MSQQAEITQLLHQWQDGHDDALERLLPLVYSQLRMMAHARLRHERAEHTLNTTALVHEAYLKLVDVDQVNWQDRAHFMAMTSRLMRRILVDYARKRQAHKRGGDFQRVEMDEALLRDDQVDTLLDLDDALSQLAKLSERQAQAVELHYFGGLTAEESAAALGVSRATVERDLRAARAWLAKTWGDRASL